MAERDAIQPDRRTILLGAGLLALAGCTGGTRADYAAPTGRLLGADYETGIYDERHFIPPIEPGSLPLRYHRQDVADPTGEKPGTIVVRTDTRFLYLVRPGGRAIRYGIGIGRAGFGWTGRAVVGGKRVWPRWRPPPEMIAREPRLAAYGGLADGQGAGPDNPLGARTLDLYSNGEDTLYRIHGSTDADAIGQAVSAGCVRMLNHDVIDLWRRVPKGTVVLVV